VFIGGRLIQDRSHAVRIGSFGMCRDGNRLRAVRLQNVQGLSLPVDSGQLFKVLAELIDELRVGKIQADAVVTIPVHNGIADGVQMDEPWGVFLQKGLDGAGDHFARYPVNLMLNEDHLWPFIEDLLEPLVEVGDDTDLGEQKRLERFPDENHSWIIGDDDNGVHVGTGKNAVDEKALDRKRGARCRGSARIVVTVNVFVCIITLSI